MNKILTAGLLFFVAAGQVNAQTPTVTKTPQERAMDKQDSTILADMIYTEAGQPAVDQAASLQQEPDWDGLRASIRAKYDETAADRAITKARIYYYFGKNWPGFTNALVHYTVTYENKENLKLVSNNAKMVLQYSQSPEEWKTALAWVKHAVDKDPANTGYKEICDALDAKIKEQ